MAQLGGWVLVSSICQLHRVQFATNFLLHMHYHFIVAAQWFCELHTLLCLQNKRESRAFRATTGADSSMDGDYSRVKSRVVFYVFQFMHSYTDYRYLFVF